MNAEEAKANAIYCLRNHMAIPSRNLAQWTLDAVAVLERIAEAEIPPHGSMDSWAINMARDFLKGVSA